MTAISDAAVVGSTLFLQSNESQSTSDELSLFFFFEGVSPSSLGQELHVTILSVFRRNGLEFAQVELTKTAEEPLLYGASSGFSVPVSQYRSQL